MIRRSKSKIIAEFGHGSIMATSAGFNNERRYTALLMQECQSGEVGRDPKKDEKPTEWSDDNPTIVLSFPNEETIDIMCRWLEKVREDMKKFGEQTK